MILIRHAFLLIQFNLAIYKESKKIYTYICAGKKWDRFHKVLDQFFFFFFFAGHPY